MKLEEKTTTVITNATFDLSERLTIDPDNLPHIFGLLTNIYSDAPSSIAREYASNGRDSHTRAGQTRPIEVTFPSHLNASFIVKDYGTGMSRDELSAIYRKYGSSTARGTNDQLGAFGIGAKSALALTNSFTVNSVKDSKRNVVIISKDEDGGSSINYLPEQATDEPNGVTVTVPVANTREFDRVLRSDIYVGWQPGTILVNGAEPDSLYDTATYTQLGEAGWFEHGRTARRDRYNSRLRAVVGPVSYTISNEVADEILLPFADKVSTEVLKQRLVLNLPNGSVSIVNNREELIFSPRTKAAIAAAVEAAIPQILAYAVGLLETAGDRKQAIEFTERLRAQGLLPIGTIAWRGEAFAVNNVGSRGRGTEFRYTFANAEVERPEEDEARLFTTGISWGWSNANSAYVMRVRGNSATLLNSFSGGGHRFVLITDAKRNKRGDFETQPKLKTWFPASGIGSGRNEGVTLYTTTRGITELPPFMVALALATVTAEEVLRIAKENHTPAPARQPRPAAQQITYTTLGNHRDKKDMIDTVYPDALDQDIKYVLAQATGPNGEGGALTLENAIYSYFRAPNNGNIPNGTTGLMTTARRQGYSFVILPATANRQKVIDLLPNVLDIDEMLAGLLTLDTDEAGKDYFALISGGLVSRRWGLCLETDRLIARGLIKQVKNPISRDFLGLFTSGNKVAQRIATYAHFVREANANRETLSATGPLTAAAFTRIEALLTHTGRTYPLLLNGIHEGAEQDAVDYINRIDKKAAKAK